jgi:hypothetical protein
MAIRTVVAKRHYQIRAERIDDTLDALLQLTGRNVAERAIDVLPAFNTLDAERAAGLSKLRFSNIRQLRSSGELC